MAKSTTVLEVFIASPSDVTAEREILETVVEEFNTTWADRHSVRLELIKWETHTRPSLGDNPQSVINEQLKNQYDIFLGLMWGRFGSPTKKAESGTEEEFNIALDRHNENPSSVQIMFYFKDEGIPPSKTDGEQIEKVKAFKKRISDECGGLYYQFETTEQFHNKARIHLSKAVQDWLDSNVEALGSTSNTEKSDISNGKEISHSPKHSEYNPLANLDALDEETIEDDVFELIELAGEAMSSVANVFSRMTDATDELGKKLNLRTDEFNQLAATPSSNDKHNRKQGKDIANSTADDLEHFVQRMVVEIPIFHEKNSMAMTSFSQVGIISLEDTVEDADEVIELHQSVSDYKVSILNSRENLKGFRDSTKQMPRMTSNFNKTRRRAVAVIEDMMIQLNVAAKESDDVIELLDRMIKKAQENV